MFNRLDTLAYFAPKTVTETWRFPLKSLHPSDRRDASLEMVIALHSRPPSAGRRQHEEAVASHRGGFGSNPTVSNNSTAPLETQASIVVIAMPGDLTLPFSQEVVTVNGEHHFGKTVPIADLTLSQLYELREESDAFACKVMAELSPFISAVDSRIQELTMPALLEVA